MTITEHCPLCARAKARMAHRHQEGDETVTAWSCGCGHRWATRYLTAAYGDPCDEAPAGYDPPDDPELQPGYWEQRDRTWDPRFDW